MTPNDIEVLIHCHISPSPHPRIGMSAVAGAIKMLKHNGLIRNESGMDDMVCWRTTERGKAFLQVLCDTPLPTQAWVDQDGDVIDFD